MPKNYNVILTGPTSFVGRNLIPKLAQQFGAKNILALTWNKDTPTGLNNAKLLKKYKITTKYIDLVTKESLDNLPNNPKIIIHLAAETNTSLSDHRANDIGTKNLYEAFEKIDKNTLMIYTGTTVYYGGRPDCTKPLTETSKPYPTNEYSRTKLKAKKYLYQKCKQDKFKLIELQLNTVYGPNSRPNSLFEHIPQKINNGSLFTRINWPGKTSLVHVDDVTDLIIHFSKLNHPKPGKPEAYILTSETRTIAEISQVIHNALNIQYYPIVIPSFIWKLIAHARNFIPNLEFLPVPLYNMFWRASLIIDDAVWTDSSKLKKTLPKWQPRRLRNEVNKLL